MDLLTMVASHHPQAIAREIEGETLVLKLDDGRMGVLNRVGGQMWELMDGTRSLAEIAQACADDYQVDLDRVQADVIAYAKRLLERDMIVLDAESASPGAMT
jgi:hypothetical protein